MTNDQPGKMADASLRDFAGGPKMFGRSTLIKLLGRGRLDVVRLACDEEPECEVALKFLPD